MADIPPLNVRVNIDASGVDTGVAKATAGLESISNKAKTTTTSLAKFRTMAIGVFGGNLLTAGVFGVSQALTNMRKEVVDTQVEMARLMTVMDNMTGVTQKDTEAIKDNIGAYATLGFGDVESTAAMGTLLTATNDVTQAQKLMAMAADYARFKHIDLNSAAQTLARGTQGSARAFKEMGISLDTTLPKNKAITKAFDELNAKIGGTAQKSTETLAVKWAIFTEQLDSFAHKIGAVIMPVFSTLVSGLSSVASWVTANQTPIMVLGGIILTVVTAVKGWAAAQWLLNAALLANPIGMWVAGIALLTVAFVKAWNASKTFREAMVASITAFVKLIGYAIGGLATMARVLSRMPGMGWLKSVADGADKAAIKIGEMSEGIEKLGKKKIKAPSIPSITGQVKPGDPVGIKGNVLGGDKSSGGKGTVQYITVYASNTNDIAKKLSKAAKNGTPIGGK